MLRRYIDCRTAPSENNCTVVISGEEDEVLELAAAHAVASHGHTDGAELREGRGGPEEWSLADVVEHLELVEQHMLSALAKAPACTA